MNASDDDSEIAGFEWDQNKAVANISKHGIDFGDAVAAFFDPQGFTLRSSTTIEPRFIRIGSANGRVVAVVFTRRGDRARKISVRAARRTERKLYE